MIQLQTPDFQPFTPGIPEKHSIPKVVDLQTGHEFDEEQLLRVIQECHQLKEYRPVVAVILKNKNGELLVVQSAKPPEDWGFLQGGIDENESLLPSLSREVREEVKLDEQEIRVEAYLGSHVLDAPQDRAEKRGFTRGKRYFFFVAEYTGNAELTLQEEEIQAAKWMSVQDAMILFSKTRAEKRDLMKRMMLSAQSALPSSPPQV